VFEKGLRLPGSHPDRKKEEKLFEKKKHNFKLLTFFGHQVGRIKVAGAFDKCVRRRILRSFICDGSRGVILVQIHDFFKNVRIFAIFWGQKSDMMDEMGRDGF
jgi:hypothetical protein